jgi:hypothetical protein
MTGDLFINSQDTYTVWGVCLEDGSEDKLLQAAPVKDYISNASRLDNGKKVLTSAVKLNERDVSLVFCFVNNGSDFITRYNSFVTELYKGVIALKVTRLGKTYNLLYLNCTSLTSFTYLGKVAVSFNEPDPTDND